MNKITPLVAASCVPPVAILHFRLLASIRDAMDVVCWPHARPSAHERLVSLTRVRHEARKRHETAAIANQHGARFSAIAGRFSIVFNSEAPRPRRRVNVNVYCRDMRPAWVLCVFSAVSLFACRASDPHSGAEEDGWLNLGAAGTDEPVMDPLALPPDPMEPGDVRQTREEAIAAWDAERNRQTAKSLAMAYFPEFDPGTRLDLAEAPIFAALEVKIPASSSEDIELSTRGFEFRIRAPDASSGDGRFVQTADTLHDGRDHFWTRVGGGRAASTSNHWLADRIEEFVVLPDGVEEYRARYEVLIPDGITAVRDAGTYLEFLDARRLPVLRMHYPVVRDAAGRSRRGTVRAQGLLESGGDPYAPLLASSDVLAIEADVQLVGFEEPLVVDPGWSSTGSMAETRYSHTSTLLPSGQVLVVGGVNGPSFTSSAELYDPATGTWSFTPPLPGPRSSHSATVLTSGRVLVAGGNSPGPVAIASALLYDPVSGSWSTTGTAPRARSSHTAVRLPSGKVLAAGGYDNGTLATADLYDPISGTWAPALSMSVPHYGHTAVVLSSGNVLVAGGFATTVAELFDPVSETWTATGSVTETRFLPTGTLLPTGQVILVGGASSGTAELYDPVSATWTATASTSVARSGCHTAVLLPSGRLLVAGGNDASSVPLASTEVYDPATATWSPGSTMTSPRTCHTATLLSSGQVLLAGSSSGALPTAELYEPDEAVFSPTGSTSVGRARHTASLLPSGMVLVVGGTNPPNSRFTAELFDPASGTWTSTGAMSTGRSLHSATTLQSGEVLVAGGIQPLSATAELYDPSLGTWSPAGTMATVRNAHGAALLPSGKVLVAGGGTVSGAIASAEIFDPVPRTWTPTGSMTSPRAYATVTTLRSGRVLVTGGGGGGVSASAEVYDPASASWSNTGNLWTPRFHHTATELPSGSVLVAGGFATVSNTPIATAEVYDPVTGTWQSTGAMTAPRADHQSTLLPSGRVLVTGGRTSSSATLDSAEIYDPATRTWSPVASMSVPRREHAATLLPSGAVLVSGGYDTGFTPRLTAEIFEPNGAAGAWWPVVDGPGSVVSGALFAASGSGFLGISAASGGRNGDSATNHPVASLESFDGHLYRLHARDFSDTALTASCPALPRGQYLLSVSVNGLRGGRIVSLSGNSAPGAGGLALTVAEDGVLAVALDGSDVNGDPLSYGLVALPSNGMLSGTAPNLTYSPTANYYGPDSFTYQANDGTELSPIATVSIDVTSVNDAPVAQSLADVTDEDVPVAVTLAATDTELDPLTYSVSVLPVHGSLSGTVPSLTYTPDADYSGPDTFSYTAHDGTTTSVPAVVSLTVSPVNDAPSAQDSSVTTAEDTAVAVSLAATDADGDPLSYMQLAAPFHGTLSGTFPALTYTPSAEYSGPDLFSYRVADGTVTSGVVTVALTVTPVNDPPAAATTVESMTAEDTTLAVTLEAMDADADPLTFAILSPPAHGSLSGAAPALLYLPTANYNGSDSFAYQASDGSLDSAVATVTITILPVNDAPGLPVPVAPSPDAEVDGDVAFAWTPVTDPEGDAITYHVEVLDEGLTVASLSSTSAGVSISALDSLPPGDYSWHVEAADTADSSGFSESWRFTVAAPRSHGSGCACSLDAEGSAPPPWGLGLALLAVLAVRSRGWRRRAHTGASRPRCFGRRPHRVLRAALRPSSHQTMKTGRILIAVLPLTLLPIGVARSDKREDDLTWIRDGRVLFSEGTGGCDMGEPTREFAALNVWTDTRAGESCHADLWCSRRWFAKDEQGNPVPEASVREQVRVNSEDRPSHETRIAAYGNFVSVVTYWSPDNQWVVLSGDNGGGRVLPGRARVDLLDSGAGTKIGAIAETLTKGGFKPDHVGTSSLRSESEIFAAPGFEADGRRIAEELGLKPEAVKRLAGESSYAITVAAGSDAAESP